MSVINDFKPDLPVKTRMYGRSRDMNSYPHSRERAFTLYSRGESRICRTNSSFETFAL